MTATRPPVDPVLDGVLAALDQEGHLEDPHDPLLLGLKGLKLLQMDQPHRALEALQEASRLAPRAEHALGIATALIALEDLEGAEEVLQQGHQLYPTDTSLLELYAKLCLDQHDYMLANTLYGKLHELTNNPAHLDSVANCVMHRRDWPAALTLLMQLLDIERTAWRLFQTACTLMFMERLDEALAYANESIVLQPTSNGFVIRARILRRLKKFKESIDDCDAALVLEPVNLYALDQRAKTRRAYAEVLGPEQAAEQSRLATEDEGPDSFIEGLHRIMQETE